MANAGSDVDDESWEDASDIFKVRSEAGETEPEEPEVPINDDEENTVIEAPPVSETNSRQSRYRTPPEAGLAPVPARRRSGMGNRKEENARQSNSKWLENSCPRPSQMLSRLPRGIGPTYLPSSLQAAKSGRSYIEPPEFKGQESCVESHLGRFEVIARRNRWDDSEKVDYLKRSLIGEAGRILCDLPDSATYNDVIFKLRRRYGTQGQYESFRIGSRQREQLSEAEVDIWLTESEPLYYSEWFDEVTEVNEPPESPEPATPPSSPSLRRLQRRRDC